MNSAVGFVVVETGEVRRYCGKHGAAMIGILLTTIPVHGLPSTISDLSLIGFEEVLPSQICYEQVGRLSAVDRDRSATLRANARRQRAGASAAPDPACPVLLQPKSRELLDAVPISADPGRIERLALHRT